jgi:uncharacterized protein
VKYYIDTSIVVAAHCSEPGTESIQRWLRVRRLSDLGGCTWLLTEVESALSIKERRGEIKKSQRRAIAAEILGFLSHMPALESPVETDFVTAAEFCKNAASRLRAGDALHLAVALRLGAKYIVTFDDVLLENALSRGLLDGLHIR